MRRWLWGVPPWPTRCLAASTRCARAVGGTMPLKPPLPDAWERPRWRTLWRRTCTDCRPVDQASLPHRRRVRGRGVRRSPGEHVGVGRPADHLHECVRPRREHAMARLRRIVLASRARRRAVPPAPDSELRARLAIGVGGLVPRGEPGVARCGEHGGRPAGAALERGLRGARRRPHLRGPSGARGSGGDHRGSRREHGRAVRAAGGVRGAGTRQSRLEPRRVGRRAAEQGERCGGAGADRVGVDRRSGTASCQGSCRRVRWRLGGDRGRLCRGAPRRAGAVRGDFHVGGPVHRGDTPREAVDRGGRLRRLRAERNLYRPSAGLAIAVGAALRRLSPARLRAVVAGLVVAGGVRTALRVPVFRDQLTVVLSELADSPRSFDGPARMVGIYLSQHRPEKALEAYRVATSTYDKMPWVHIAGADAALTLGRSALADSMVRRVDALCARCDYYYRFEARIAQTRGDSG